MGKHTVYVVHTPLHLLFALTIIGNSVESAVLLVVNDYPSARRIYKEIPKIVNIQTELLAGAFSRWGMIASWGNTLPTPFRWVGKLLNHIPLLQIMVNGKRLLRHYDVSKLYVFNDTRADLQALIKFAGDQGAELIYVEDGLGAYLNILSVSPAVSRYKWLSRLIYGNLYEPVSNQGGYSLIQRAIILHPDYANNSLFRCANIQKMPPFSLYDLAMKLGNIFAGDMFVFKETEVYGLICLPHSDLVVDSGYIESLILEIIEICKSRGLNVLVKFHPREKCFTGFNLQTWPDIQIIDQNVAAELICAILGSRLEIIFSPLSSVLLTANWIIKGIKIYQIGMPEKQPSLHDLLSVQGVKFITDPADVVL